MQQSNKSNCICESRYYTAASDGNSLMHICTKWVSPHTLQEYIFSCANLKVAAIYSDKQECLSNRIRTISVHRKIPNPICPSSLTLHTSVYNGQFQFLSVNACRKTCQFLSDPLPDPFSSASHPHCSEAWEYQIYFPLAHFHRNEKIAVS